MPIQVVKDPQTGEERRVYVPPSGMGETTTPAKPKAQPQPQPQRQSQPSFGLADLTGALPIFGMMNQLQITGGSIGAAVREYQRSGDLGKAYQAGQKQYIKELEQPGRAAQRVPAMAGRNIAQEVSDVVTADLPAALGVPGAKPTTAKRPDAPFLGVMPALPKVKSSGPAEDIATGIVQAGVEWFPAARAVGLVGKGAKLLPGAAKVAGAVRGATKAAAATKAAQAVSKVPGAAVVGKALAENTITKAAATGALVDVVGFDQYGGRLTDLIDNAVKGTPLEGVVLDYLKSDPNDVGMEGRLKNGLEGGLFGTGLEVAFRTLRVARNYNWWRRAPEEQKPAAEEGLKQATQDLETEVAKQAYTVPDPWGPGTVPNLPGAARPTNQALLPPARTEVAEVNVDAIQTDPKRFQFKAEGRKAEGGVAAPITDEQGFNPLKGGVVSVWTDPADGVTYVVNGHSRLAAAKGSGYDKILVRQIQAETAEEAKRIGALQNISEGQVTPKDAGTFVRQSGMTAQDMAAEGISLDNPAIAKQVDAEVKAAPAADPGRPLVKAGIELSHGTSEAGRKGILTEGFRTSEYERSGTVAGEGVYMTPSEKYAGEYGSKMVRGTLPDNARILDWTGSDQTLASLADEIGIPGPRKLNKSAGEIELDQAQQQQLKQWALDNGYDGIQYRTNFTPGGKATEVVIYNTDLANYIVRSKAAPDTLASAPAAEPSVPSAGTSAAAPPAVEPPAAPARTAGPTAAEIAELDRTLAQARADLPPQQRVALRNQVLAQRYPSPTGEPPSLDAPITKTEMDAVQLDPEDQAILDQMQEIADRMGEQAKGAARNAQSLLNESAGLVDAQDMLQPKDAIVPSPRARSSAFDPQAAAEQVRQMKQQVEAGKELPPEERMANLEDIDRQLSQLEADLAGRIEPTLGGSGGEPPAPPPAVVEPPSFDEGWAQQLVRQMEQQRQGLEEGTITMDDLLENNVQKIVSPSGATSYVASPPTSAIQAYRAFSDVFTRPDATGIPVMSFERVQKDTEAWLSKVGYDGQAVLENLKQLSGPLGNYQENLVALRAAQLYADHSNLQAGIAANKWLNAAADESVDVGQLTAELLTAAAQQKAANLALESVTRPIGQLLYSLQNPRPTPGSLPFDEGLPPTKDLGKELEDALEVEAQTPVSESIGKALSPEAEEAILTGNYTPQVLAEVDQLARNMAQSAVTPGFAKGFWRQVNDSVAIGARGLVIYRASQLLSSGLTLWSNAINGVFRMVQMPLSQALGAAAQLEFSRVPQSLMMYGQYVSNLQNALRLGVESFKAGRGLYDLDQTSVDFLDKMAKQDLESTLLPPAVDRKAEWDLNTMPWLDVQDKSVWALAQKRLWQTLNLSTRTQVSIDTFFKVLAGQSYEYVRNLQPGLDRAIQQGLTPGSKEAWQFAKEYAQAAVDRATRDVAIDGRTILDAVMTSPQAQSAMRYATFTDDIWAEMGPKTYEGGMQLAKAKGLEGAAAEEAVRKYLEAPAEVPFFGRTFSMMPAAWQKLIDFSPLFSIIQPFNRTPGDLVKSAARMGGLTAPLVDTWWRDLNSEDAFTRDRAIGDMAVGMAAISLGTIAMTHGRIQFTGGGPANPEAKKKWRDEGNQPYSFRVRTGDEWSPWTSMRVFEPLSTIFGAMADYQEIANKIPKEARERLGSALGMDLMLAVAAGQLSKTYYQGFSELYEAAMGVGEVDVGPNKRNPVERYVSRILASMVPASSALRAGRRIEDPIVRDIPPSPVEGGLQGLPMRLFQETLGEIRNMIPGWSESLPPRRNWITGEPIVLSGILGDQYLPPDQPWLSTVFQFVPWSPFQVAPKQDPVLVEMAKLSGKGANFRGPQPTDWGRELRLDPVQFDQYVQTASNVKDQFGRTIYQALNDLINSEYYKSLPDEEVSTTVMSQKAAAIDLEVQKFRKLGKEAFEANNPALVRDLRNIEGLNKDVQYRLKYGQPIDVNRFTEALR